MRRRRSLRFLRLFPTLEKRRFSVSCNYATAFVYLWIASTESAQNALLVEVVRLVKEAIKYVSEFRFEGKENLR